MNRVETAIARSADEFRRTVWPHFAEALGGGELIPVETVTESGFAKALDTLGMTDAWHFVDGTGIRGLATRIQWDYRSWDSWTVRTQTARGSRQTERLKLTREGAWHLPQYVIQGYVHTETGRLLGAAAIRTRDLRMMLRNGWHGHEIRNGSDGSLFVPVWWKEARERGFTIIERPSG